MDARIKFGDSRSNRSRDIRVTHFVMDDDERTTPADGPCGIGQSALWRLA